MSVFSPLMLRRLFLNLVLCVNALAFGFSAWGQSFSVQEKVTNLYSPYWFSGFTRADYEMRMWDIGGGQVSTYSFVNLNYRLGQGQKITLRIPFIISSAGWSQYEDKAPAYHKADAFFEDPIISLVDNNLILLPGDIQVYWEGRVYIPVGQQSLLENRIMRLRNDFILSKNLTQKLEINWVNNVNYYVQSKTTYYTDVPLNEEVGERLNVLTNTRQWRVDNRLDLWYKFSYDFGIGMQFYARSDVYYQAPVQYRFKDTETEYAVGPQVRFSVGDIGNMIFSVSHRVPKQDFGDLLKIDRDNINVTALAFYMF